MTTLKIQRTKCSDCGRYISFTVEGIMHHYNRVHGKILNQRQAKIKLTRRRIAGFYTEPGKPILLTTCRRCGTAIPWNRDGIIYHFRKKHHKKLSPELAHDLLTKFGIADWEEKTKHLPESREPSKSLYGMQGGAPGLGRRR